MQTLRFYEIQNKDRYFDVINKEIELKKFVWTNFVVNGPKQEKNIIERSKEYG